MNRDQKTAVVDEIADQIQAAEAIFAVDYRGISVSQAAELRGKLRSCDTRFRIVKNSLTERAADKAGAEALKAMLEGPTALAFVGGDAAIAAKALNEAARTMEALEFKGGLMDGATLSADQIRSIARLPAREVLHAQLVGTIASPLAGLVRTLNALLAGLAVQLQQIAEQGLVSGAPPAAAEAGAAEAAPAEEASARAEEPAEAEAAEPEAVAEPEAEAAAEPEAVAEPESEAAAEPEAETEQESQPDGTSDEAAPSEE
jgi:large subunit ribosomal protein L10